MQEITRDYYFPGEFFSRVKALFGYLRKRLVSVLVVAFVCGGVGWLGYYLQKPKYQAELTFILEEKSGGGALAGLASQFGVNLGGMSGGGNMLSGDNILEILKSKKVIRHVLLTGVGGNKGDSTLLIDIFFKNYGPKETTFRMLANDDIAVQDSLLDKAIERIILKHLSIERVKKQGSIIKVRLISADRTFARLVIKRLVQEASRLYLEARTGTAQQNILQLQQRADSILRLLNVKSFGVASIQQLDANPGMRIVSVPGEIATRDKTVLATIYVEVIKNLEASKMILSQESPAIQILDEPDAFIEDKRKSAVLLSVIGFFIGAILATGYHCIRFYIPRIQ